MGNKVGRKAGVKLLGKEENVSYPQAGEYNMIINKQIHKQYTLDIFNKQ